MKRKEFLKQIISFAPILVTPSIHAISSVSKSYVYLLHDFIRGFQYYKGEALFENLKEEDALELVREYDNKYDRYAIAIYWNGHKLGFVAREKNNLFAKLMDAQIVSFKAKIKALEGEASSWEQVFYQIYIEKESDLQSNAKYLTLSREPRYRDYTI
jgi:hypothetical protein